jgi:predicted phosphodiesterase
MKTLILADCHEKDPSELITSFTQERGIEKLALLGDIETPDILRKIISTVEKNKLRFIYTPGNHEYSFVHKEKGFVLRDQFLFYTRLWEEAPKEKQFVIEASKDNNLDKSFIVRDENIVYAHSSLVHGPSLDNPHVSDVMCGRIHGSEKLLEANFKKMTELGNFKLFFRGHDHLPVICKNDSKINNKIDHPVGKYTLDLEKNRTIVTVGAFCYGRYVAYNSQTKEVEFATLGNH